MDVKTKKSKEVSVRCFGRREWESGDRFRLFFFFSFFLSFFFFPCGRRQNRLSLSRVEKRIFNNETSPRGSGGVYSCFFSPNERKRLTELTFCKLSSFTSQPHTGWLEEVGHEQRASQQRTERGQRTETRPRHGQKKQLRRRIVDETGQQSGNEQQQQ